MLPILCLTLMLFLLISLLLTRRLLTVLLSFSLVFYLLLDGSRFFPQWLEASFRVLGDPGTLWILLACGFYGSLVKLLEETGDLQGFTEWVLGRCRRPASTLLAAWLLGMLFSGDEFAGPLTAGAWMREPCRRRRVSARFLAYIASVTGSSGPVLFPLSSWACFFTGALSLQPELEGLGGPGGPYTAVLPYVFFPVVCLLLSLTVIAGRIPSRFGSAGVSFPGAAGEGAAASGGRVGRGVRIRWLLPLLLLAVLTFLLADFLPAVLAALACAALLSLFSRGGSPSRAAKACRDGFAGMLPAFALLFAGLMVQQGLTELRAATYLITWLEPLLTPEILPAAVFVLAAFLSFVTGSSWLVPAVCLPLLSPLAVNLGAHPGLTLGALISAAAFGSHAGFFSPNTIIAAQAAGSGVWEHARSKLPYALTAYLITLGLYLAGGFFL